MSIQKQVTLLCAMLLVSGCANLSLTQYGAEAYLSDPDITRELKQIKGLGYGIAVSEFKLAEGADVSLYCRDHRPIVLPGGQGFTDYVRSALVEELEAAGLLSSVEAADVVLSGELKTFRPVWAQGVWRIEFELASNRGNDTMRPTDAYRFANANQDSNSEAACKSAALAIAPAVQKMIRTIASSWHFKNNLLL